MEKCISCVAAVFAKFNNLSSDQSRGKPHQVRTFPPATAVDRAHMRRYQTSLGVSVQCVCALAYQSRSFFAAVSLSHIDFHDFSSYPTYAPPNLIAIFLIAFLSGVESSPVKAILMS